MTIYKGIQRTMQDDHTDVICAVSENEAINILMHDTYCMVIMRIPSPLDEALNMIHHIRGIISTPILVLTNCISAAERALLLRAGANACLEMPFNVNLCVAQAQSLMQLYTEAQVDHSRNQPLIFGQELIIDPIYHQVIVDGEPLALTRTEFDLLFCLAKRPCRIWSGAQLYQYVRGDDLGVSGENTVRAHIGNLRKKLADVGKNYIQNSRGIGYKFVPPDQ